MARTGRTSRLLNVLAPTSTSRTSSLSTFTTSGCCMPNVASLFANSTWLTASTRERRWSWIPVRLPPELQHGLAGEGTLAFVDDQHGWMILNSANASARAGALLVTSDGGRNWRDTHDDDPGGQGPVVLLTPEEGWMAGGEHDDDLHVTRDGAKSWQTISLPAPKEISPAKFRTADAPVFEDSKHGFVAVTFTGGHQSAAVLFATDDGGRNWKADRILSNLEETSEGNECSPPSSPTSGSSPKSQTIDPSSPLCAQARGCARLSIPHHTRRAISEPIN